MACKTKNDVSATQAALDLLRCWPEQELSMIDFAAELGPRGHDRGNLHMALIKLVQDGKVVRNIEEEQKRSYWAIKVA